MGGFRVATLDSIMGENWTRDLMSDNLESGALTTLLLTHTDLQVMWR